MKTILTAVGVAAALGVRRHLLEHRCYRVTRITFAADAECTHCGGPFGAPDVALLKVAASEHAEICPAYEYDEDML